jgi:hypothetical protein
MASQQQNRLLFFFNKYIYNYMSITGNFMIILLFCCPVITIFSLVGHWISDSSTVMTIYLAGYALSKKLV